MTAKMDVTKCRMMSADDTGTRAAGHSPLRRREQGGGAVGRTLADESRRAGRGMHARAVPVILMQQI
jgi:hypothetical protein